MVKAVIANAFLLVLLISFNMKLIDGVELMFIVITTSIYAFFVPE